MLGPRGMAERLNKRFAAVFVAQLAYLVWRIPSLTTQPHAFAESGAHFFTLARDLGWWQNLCAHDSGSLAWPNRLLALLYVKGLGLRAAYAGAIQWSTNLLVALSVAWFNLDACRAFVRDDRLRLLATLILLSGVFTDYECYTMVNAGYFYFIPALIMLLQDQAAWSRGGTALRAVAVGLAVAAKAYGLALLPLAALGLLTAARKRKARQAAFHATVLAFGACQAFRLLTARSHIMEPWATAPHVQAGWPLVWPMITQSASLWRDVAPALGPLLGWIAALPLALLLLLGALRRRKDRPALLWSLALLWTGAFALALALTQLPYLKAQGWSWQPQWERPGGQRWYFYPHICALLLGVTYLDRWSHPLPRWAAPAYLLAWGLALAFLRTLPGPGYYYPERDPPWRWSDTAALLERPRYYIPLDPLGWGMGKGLTLLNPNWKPFRDGSITYGMKPGAPPLRVWGLELQLPADTPPVKAWAMVSGQAVLAENFSPRGGRCQYVVWEGGVPPGTFRIEPAVQATTLAVGGPP